MRSVQVVAPGKLEVKEIPIPVPPSGYVLVKVESSPINPSDYHVTRAEYDPSGSGQPPKLPFSAGVEGSGTVVENGGGFLGWRLKGKRVGFVADKLGAWSEYVLVNAQYCISLDDDVSFNEGCSCFVNPMTVSAFYEICKQEKMKALVQDAANSQLARMLIRLCKAEGIKTINIVRKEEQKKELLELGATVVLNQTDKDFDEQVKKLAKEHDARIFFDAIGGDFPARVLKAMPPQSTCYMYGSLTHDRTTNFDVRDMLFNEKVAKGFLLSNWALKQSTFTMISVFRRVSNNLKTFFQTKVAKEFPLEQAEEAIAYYYKDMSQGKVVLKPSLKPQ